MSDCPNSAHGHELDYHDLFGEVDDPLRLRQRADCIHCSARFWVVYERAHIEACGDDERGYHSPPTSKPTGRLPPHGEVTQTVGNSLRRRGVDMAPPTQSQ